MYNKFMTMENLTREVNSEEISERVKEMFSCSCGRILSNPYSLKCGHTMCKDCLIKREYICQTCGENYNFDKDSLSVDMLLLSILFKLYPEHCEIEKLKVSAKEYEQNGDLDNAIENLTAAKEINDKDITVLNARSSLLSKKKLYSQARTDAEISVELDQTNGHSHFCLGAALSGLKLLDEAIESYSNCLTYSYEDTVLFDAVSNQMDYLLSGVRDCNEMNEDDINETTRKRKHSSENHKKSKKSCYEKLVKKSISIDDVRCSLCLEVLFQPVTTVCGHSFCKSCLMRSLDYKPGCPNCRAPQREILSSQSIEITAVTENFLLQHFPEQYSQMLKSNEEKQKLSAKVGLDPDVEVPILICMVALPSISWPLNIFEPKYRGMLRECLESGSKRFGACCPVTGGHADTGTILKVTDVKYSTDGKALVTTVGEKRFKIIRTITRGDGLLSAVVNYINDDWQQINKNDISKIKETCESVYDKLCKYCMSLKPEAKECIRRALGDMPELDVDVSGNPNGACWLWWAIAALPLNESLKIRFLKSNSFPDRIGSIDRYLQSILKRSTVS